MKPLYTQEQFIKAKPTEKLPLECSQCNKLFFKQKRLITFKLNHKSKENSCRFCSSKCFYQSKIIKKVINCTNCSITFEKPPSQMSKSGSNFCSQSCAAIYQNTHKSKGYRRSKLEIYLENQLIALYPNLEFHFNKKDTINSELDIYIPSLSLAFELNGIFHYEPIYGPNKLNQIQNNDQNKFQKCQENKIDLCIIDTSGQKYVKPSTSQKYLDIITNIINQRT